MLQTEPTQPHIAESLENIIKRLMSVRENLSCLANEFGIHLDHPEMPHPDRERTLPGLDQLRLAITEINTQIAYIEQEHDRLYAARAQLFGIGDGKWQECDMPNPGPGPIQQGNWRNHP